MIKRHLHRILCFTSIVLCLAQAPAYAAVIIDEGVKDAIPSFSLSGDDLLDIMSAARAEHAAKVKTPTEARAEAPETPEAIRVEAGAIEDISLEMQAELSDVPELARAEGDSGEKAFSGPQDKKPDAAKPARLEGDSGEKAFIKTQATLEVDWFTGGINTLFARGSVVTVTDVETGISWREHRMGGTNHADVEPLTKADTEKLKGVYGDSWSWERRAVWVTIGGVRYAASMNGMPHGRGTIDDNEFAGHHCIHFKNSRTHGSNRVDKRHQQMIAYAASMA